MQMAISHLVVSRNAPEFEDVTESTGLAEPPHGGSPRRDPGLRQRLLAGHTGDGIRPRGHVSGVFRRSGLEGDVPPGSPHLRGWGPQYWVTGPVADVDRDGRLDVFLVEWEPAVPSLLLHNETASGNWLSVSVDP